MKVNLRKMFLGLYLLPIPEFIKNELSVIEATIFDGQGYLNYVRFPVQDYVVPHINKLLLSGIKKLNSGADRSLAWQLYKLADKYDPKSKGDRGNELSQ